MADRVQTAGALRGCLQDLIDRKERQIQHAGLLGQRGLEQQLELEERVAMLRERQGDCDDDDELDAESQALFSELADLARGWDTDNGKIVEVFDGNAKDHVPMPSDPADLSTMGDLSREEPELSTRAGAQTAAQSRRAKNAAHREVDVEFAYEIGTGLLTEVRRLQSLLAERDKVIQEMKDERYDLDKSLESLRTALRQQEQSADKFKEENWNLEVNLQELRVTLGDAQASVQRLEGEQKRLTKSLAGARETGDHHKTEAERVQGALDELKAKHETDIAQARKHAASLQRDKVDLQQSLDNTRSELARASKRLPRFGSPLTPNGAGTASDAHTPALEEDDVFGGGGHTGTMSTRGRRGDTSGLFAGEFGEFMPDDELDASPTKSFLSPHPRNDLEALQQKLAHANRQIGTLKSTLQREKEQKIEYRRIIESSPGFAVQEEEEDVEEAASMENGLKPPKARKVTPYRSVRGRGRGRARGRGGFSLSDRLAMAGQSPGSEFSPDFDEPTESPPPPVPSLPSGLRKPDPFDDEDEENIFNVPTANNPGSPSPSLFDKRTSVDGMDPAFANILRRANSANTVPTQSSPLRQAVVPRGGTLPRRRGGAAYQEARPPSVVVGGGEALALELGLGDESIFREREEQPKVEVREFACQTDPEPEKFFLNESTIVLPEAKPAPLTAEMAIQVEPEPLPPQEPVPVPILAEISVQTDAVAASVLADVAVQHDTAIPLPIVPIRADAAILTDRIEEPQVLPRALREMVTQTSPRMTAVVETQTIPLPVAALAPAPFEERERRTTLTQRDVPHSIVLGAVSAGGLSRHSTVRTKDAPVRSFGAHVESDAEDDDARTETGADVEAETVQDEYEDARQNMAMMTPSTDLDVFIDARQELPLLTPATDEGNDDFHSIMTVTDNEFSDSERDATSVRAPSVISRNASVSAHDDGVISPVEDTTHRQVLYEDKGVSAEPVQDVVAITAPVPHTSTGAPDVLPLPPPKDLKDSSVQTDRWPLAPTTPTQTTGLSSSILVPIPVAASPTKPSLFRVGSSSQQFQFIPASSPSSVVMPSQPTPTGTPVREGNTTIMARPRTSMSERRQSIESAMSSLMEDHIRSRTASSVNNSPAIDRTRPPVMAVPPPPRLPPPPPSSKSVNMPPPSFIPDRRQPTKSNASSQEAPARPSSPPPSDLLKRATTPSLNPALSVPVRTVFGARQAGSSMPATQSSVRQLPSTSSFRSAANAASQAPSSIQGALLAPVPVRGNRRELSSTSLASNASPRSSISSERMYTNGRASAMSHAPGTPNRPQFDNRASMNPTDPIVIHSITQAMIGEFLYKYTRRTIGKGLGERRHKRFFWVHPYTKTLYWGSSDPGSAGVSESTAKSAYIEGVRAVLDPNPMPPGLYQYSIIVSTPQREMKFTAPSKERHDIWLNALNFLLTRQSAASAAPSGGLSVPSSPLSANMQDFGESPQAARPAFPGSPESHRSRGRKSLNTTPRGRRSASQLSMGGSVGKRSGTPALEYLRWSERDATGPYSPSPGEHSFEHVPGGADEDDEDLDFELNDDGMSDGGFEGLENVRACCDGRHTVGHNHRHHHTHTHAPEPSAPEPPSRAPSRNQGRFLAANDAARPISPSGWSLRSRAGSTNSRDGLGLFGRFGSRRSTKTPVNG